MQSLKRAYANVFPQRKVVMDKFPFFQPRPAFLSQTLPKDWKSTWHDRELWHTHPSFNLLLHQRDWFQQISLGLLFFAIYLSAEEYGLRYGDAGIERDRLELYMQERAKRLHAHEHAENVHH